MTIKSTNRQPVIVNPSQDLVLFERAEAHAERLDTYDRVYIEYKAATRTAPGVHLGRVYGSLRTTVEPLGQLLLRADIGPLRLHGKTYRLATDIVHPSDIPEGITDIAALALRLGERKELRARFEPMLTITLLCGALKLFSVTSDEFVLIPGIEKLPRAKALPLLPPWAQAWVEATRPTTVGSSVWRLLIASAVPVAQNA
jgi:hypothetical protein